MKVALVIACCLDLWLLSPASRAQQLHPHAKARPHIITDGEITVIQDCHKIALDADDALQQARQESPDGRARLGRPQHGTAYDCYTTEKPVYNTLLNLFVKGKISDEGHKLMTLVEEDMAYFQLGLTENEK